MKIAIVGSRGFQNYELLKHHIISYFSEEDFFSIEEIISGGARGADELGERFARDFNIPLKLFKPDWDKYGKKAGFLRNIDIINACDICFAFWDGESKGTKHDIDLCEKNNKICSICLYDKQ